MNANDGDYDEIAFEAIDSEIFGIPDDKTRLNTLQGYFFPRLERLVKQLCETVRLVYDVDPFEQNKFTYRPAHRKDAGSVRDFGEVYIGLSPGRSDQWRNVLRPNGIPFQYHPSSLLITAIPEGALQVSFRPYSYNVNPAFRESLHEAVAQSWNLMAPVVELARLATDSTDDLWLPLKDSLLTRCSWESTLFHFPLSERAWLGLIEVPFVVMYPLLDTAAHLAQGKNHRLPWLIERFRTWFEEDLDDDEDEVEESEPTEDSIPSTRSAEVGLDNYRMIRNGLWYQVLARDSFTCCACKRSAQEHGVVLHVDHIQPRSLGGTDDASNLQTLCMKCNTGKSNRDNTRLTTTGFM